MSCCVDPDSVIALAKDNNASRDELLLASRPLGDGLLQVDLSVPAAHCGACITTIESALKRLPVVEQARVNLTSRRVSCVWRETVDGKPSDPTVILDALTGCGYRGHLFTAAAEEDDKARTRLLQAVGLSGFAATNIMLLSVSVWSGADAATRDLFHWISAAIAAPTLIYAGRFFYASAWNALKRGRTNMDVPIALAITLSYAVSLWETIHHGEHAWFDATVTLLFFLLIGRTLDHDMRNRARSAITGLARLVPRGATVLNDDGQRRYMPVEEIAVGDRIALTAGERVPVDATVISGASDVDMSIVTGESRPVAVSVGSELKSGAMNLTGSLTVRAVATARDSLLSEIIGLMEAAEGGRARYRRIADRAASYYSPVVHLLALITFLGWGIFGGDWKQAMLISVAVLIITCPCALGLAVPVVQVVAAGELFRRGIMVKDGSAMERLAEIDAVAFDKTGTLTLGRPRLVDSSGEAGDRAIAAGMAAHSRHPLSMALAGQFDALPAALDGVREIPGAGLETVRPDGIWRLGNPRFALTGAAAETDEARSAVVLSLDGRERARFLFEDMLRPGAEGAVAALQQRGFSAYMLSGDGRAVVADTARRLGIDGWFAALTPKGKVEVCEDLAAKGHRVLMVGDGINDAPALAAAYVSMAPASAADVGRQAADLVFLHESLDAVPDAIDMSRKAGRLIRENFALAIGYNIIAVPIAIAGYATPLIAAVAMSTSSLIVVANALRLGRMARRRPAADRQPRTAILSEAMGTAP